MIENQLSQADRPVEDERSCSAPAGEYGDEIAQQTPDSLHEPRYQPEADRELGQRTLGAGALGTVIRKAIRTDTVSRGHKYDSGPRYAWLEAEKARAVHVQGWAKSEAPGSPLTVVDPDLDLRRDEPADVVIIGGGPHALAALAALNEGALGTDQTRICVIDPGSHFMQAWNTRFEALEIDYLRSPALAHPAAFDPTALVNYAIDKGRTSELRDAPVSSRWLASTDIDRERWLKSLPSSALFRDFCASLESELPHRWASGYAANVSKDGRTGEYDVRYKTTADGREHAVAARAVILATGPVGKWRIPAPFEPHLASRLVLHTEELLQTSNGKGTLSEEITRRCPSESARVLVIGGGISAAQAAVAAARAGHQVVLRSRRPLQTRPFDIDHGWLDMRKADRMRFEFLCLPYHLRLSAVRKASSGGSVPANYMEELHRLSQTTPNLTLEVDEAIDASKVRVDSKGEHVVVNGETFAMVILATGVVTAPSCGDSSPLYRSVQELLKAPTVDGLPRVDSRLRWVPNENVFVLGANAALELGPGALNLMGAMRGARVVSNELHGLLNHPQSSDDRTAARRELKFFTNQYTSLGDRVRFGDGCDSEIDFLAQQLHLTPKAEVELRRGCGSTTAGLRQKKSKATPYLHGVPLKGTLKGERDPMGHLATRTRWATYW